MKCILLAVDDRPVKGAKKAPYTMNTMGLPLFAHGFRAISGAGYHVSCVMTQEIKDQISKNAAPEVAENQIAQYTQDAAWLDAYGTQVILLLDAAVFYLSDSLIHDLKNRSLSVEKEPVSYRVGERSVALLVRADILKAVWAKAFPDPTKRRFLTQLVLALQAQNKSTYEDTLSKEEALVIDELHAHHLATEHIRRQKLVSLMAEGVQILDIYNTFIDTQVVIGEGTVIYPGCVLQGATRIGEDCVIGPAARIDGCTLGNGVTVKDSTLIQSTVDDATAVGPYAYLRPDSKIGKNVKIGDFVEVKNAVIEDNSKVSHLSYIGDGFVGKNVNVGCGVVFVNYDGKKKHKTVIEDDAFVGCNANLVAPVTIKRGAYVAAGSTITEDVEADSLAIARSRQTQKINWVLDKK